MGRRPGTSRSERLLRAAFAAALSQAIGSERGAQSRAATALGTSRQAISLYLKQRATPGPDILHRACEIWSLELQIEGTTTKAGTFPVRKIPKTEVQQTPLFAALNSFEDRQLRVPGFAEVCPFAGTESIDRLRAAKASLASTAPSSPPTHKSATCTPYPVAPPAHPSSARDYSTRTPQSNPPAS